MVDLAPREVVVFLDLVVNPEDLVQLVTVAFPDLLEAKEHLDPLESLDQLVPPEKLEPLDKLDLLDHVDPLENLELLDHLVKTDWLDAEDLLENVEPPETMVTLEHLDMLDLKEHPEKLVFLVKSDPLDLWDHPENVENLVPPDAPEKLDHPVPQEVTELQEIEASPVTMDHQDLPDLLDLKVNVVALDSLVLKENLDPWEFLELLVPLENPEETVLMDHQDPSDQWDLLDIPETLAKLDQLVNLEYVVCLVLWAAQEIRDLAVLVVPQELKVLLDHREWSDHLDPLELLEREAREENVVSLAFKDQPDPVDLLVPSVLQEMLENADTLELRETKDGWDLQVCQETQDLRDKLEIWDLLDHPEEWDQEDVMEAVATTVKMVNQDLLEFPDNAELVDHPEVMAVQVTPDHQDHPDHQVTLPLTQYSHPELKDPKDPTQLKAIMAMKLNLMKSMLLTRLPGQLKGLGNQRVPRMILVLLAVTSLCAIITKWKAVNTLLILMANLSSMPSKCSVTWRLERHACTQNKMNTNKTDGQRKLLLTNGS